MATLLLKGSLRTKNKIVLNDVLIMLMALPMLVKGGIQTLLGIGDVLMLLITLADIMLIVSMYAIGKVKMSPVMKIMALIYLTIFASAFLHGNWMLTLINLMNGFAMCLLFDYWLIRKPRRFIKVMSNMLTALVVANLFTILVFPDGMYATSIFSQNWLLGYKNSHMGYVMAAVVLRGINLYMKRGKLSFGYILFILSMCVGFYLVDAATALLIMSIYLICMVVVHFNDRCRFFQWLVNVVNIRVMIVWVALFMIVFVLNDNSLMLESNQMITGIFNSLGRNASFTGRVGIWLTSLEIIKDSPIIGYGIIDPNRYASYTGLVAGTHAHNYILNIFVMGGLVCFVEHVFLYQKVLKRLASKRNLLSLMLGIVMGLYFLAGITSLNFYEPFFNSLFILTYHVLKSKGRRFVRQ